MVLKTIWLGGLEACHPIIFPIFKEVSGLRFGQASGVYLFDQGKSGVVVMSWEQEVFVEGAPIWARDIVPGLFIRRLAGGLLLPTYCDFRQSIQCAK